MLAVSVLAASRWPSRSRWRREQHRSRGPCSAGLPAAPVWIGGATAAGAGGVQALLRAMAPVDESSPCSSTVTREYSRSRSLFSVSMADASRFASLWLSLATDWICCACRARSAAATWSRRHADRGLIGEDRQNHRADRGDAPRSQPPQRAAVEYILLRQKAGQQAAGILGLETASHWPVRRFFAIRSCRPSRGLPESQRKH